VSGAVSAGLVLRWLRDRARPIEEKGSDLLVGRRTDVHRTMDPVGWFVPVHLAGRNCDVIARAPVPVLDLECVTAENHRDPMVGIPVPRHGFAWGELEPSNERHAALVENLLGHRREPGRRLTAGMSRGEAAGSMPWFGDRVAQPHGRRPDATLNATGTLMPPSTKQACTSRSNAARMRACTALGCRRMPIDVLTVPRRIPFQSSSGLARQ